MSQRGFSLRELAQAVGGRVEGDPARRLTGVAVLAEAGPAQLSFFTNRRYRAAAEATRAGAVLVGEDAELGGRDLLRAPQPYVALAEILALFHPPAEPVAGIDPRATVAASSVVASSASIGPTAVVGERVRIGEGVRVGPGSVIGDDCAIGDGSELHARVVLYAGTQVGRRCRLHSGVVLGGDGFGFATAEGRHHKIPQVGRVVIEDDVEIGANSTVDRATIGETRIGRGTKIDDLVMVAHGVHLGEDCLLAAQAGIAGSTRVGRGVTFAGQSGAAGHLEIGDGVVVAGKTAVFQDLPAGAFVAGIPAIDHRAWKRALVALPKLPELRRDLRRLLQRLEAGEE